MSELREPGNGHPQSEDRARNDDASGPTTGFRLNIDSPNTMLAVCGLCREDLAMVCVGDRHVRRHSVDSISSGRNIPVCAGCAKKLQVVGGLKYRLKLNVGSFF